MWVEADCNLISGESMIRQILYGKNFFMDEFGVEVKNLWLPDVFGYAASMPQILVKSGLDYFLTQKLSWNQINEFPHHTFNWRGIDGTEILTHFPPENTYGSQLNTKFIVPGRDNFKEKDFIDEFICLYGMGNGGGGPKEENIEYGMRLENLEGAPKVTFGRADTFFDNLARYKEKLATWVGELYLELHRGTLASQALVKKANRKLELKLRLIEFLWSCIPLDKYPQNQLETIWKKVLINQFHDIIPGSSINAVYNVTHGEYEEAFEELQKLLDKSADHLFEKDNDSIVLFNSLSYPYRGTVTLADGWPGAKESLNNNVLEVQNEGGKNLVLVEVPALSFVTLSKAQNKSSVFEENKDLVLENDLVRYEFCETGVIIDVVDKEEDRQVLEEGKEGNVLSLYNDRPNQWDAWDIDQFYEEELLEQARCIKIEKHSHGCVRQGLDLKFEIGNSEIFQEIYLTAGSKRLDFHTKVNWAEQHHMLRVAFPVNVQTTQASFDIQYGFIQRNTHRNTSWDMAKFEVAAHRYADLSDKEYGVALLNDCKYGYKVHDTVLDLNLLRSPRNPDPDADLGEHDFIYSFFPHIGDLVNSHVMSESAQLNQPASTFNGYRLSDYDVPVRLTGEGLSLEVIKKAEKEDSLVIRIVETLGKTSSGSLHINSTEYKLIMTNLIEWVEGHEQKGDGSFEIRLNPFEIRTYKIKPI